MLNEALRLIRVYHDISQQSAAHKLGISKSYLCEIERGRKQPTLDLIKKYSIAFDIPISSIMFFSESIDNQNNFDPARAYVAGKILKLLGFLEERSHSIDET